MKLIAPYVSGSLTKVLNCSLQSGICSDVLKIARVTPIHKIGPKSDPTNYRPISTLPVISKLIERHISVHLRQFFVSHKLIISTQSGFRPHHSTEFILVNMTDDWLEAMDKGHYMGLLFLDFRKAFDLIHHDILLKKLAVYGFSQSAINGLKAI